MRWTRADVIAWLHTLGRTNDQQRSMVQYLLRHARRDGMSSLDRKICVKALDVLEGIRGRHP